MQYMQNRKFDYLIVNLAFSNAFEYLAKFGDLPKK